MASELRARMQTENWTTALWESLASRINSNFSGKALAKQTDTRHARVLASGAISLLVRCASRGCVQASVPNDCAREGKDIDEADSRAVYKLSVDAVVLGTTFCI